MKRNYFRQRHPSKCLVVGAKTYSITDYTVDIDNSGTISVIKRSNSAIQESIALTSTPAEISKSGSDFYIVGCSGADDGYVNQTGLENNSVTLTQEFVLENIGGTDTIDLNSYNAIVVLDCSGKDDVLKFYKK